MATDNIQTKTLAACLAAVIGVEVLARGCLGRGGTHQILFAGSVRLVQGGIIIATALLLEKGLGSIGIYGRDTLKGIWRGCLWSAGFAVLAAIAFSFLLGAGLNPLNLIHVRLPADPSEVLLFFLTAGLLGPVTEELLFRGVIYGFFRRWGAPAAVLLSTLAFVLSHPLSHGIPVVQTVGGLLFGVGYEVEENILVPITLHVTGNMAIFTLSLIFR